MMSEARPPQFRQLGADDVAAFRSLRLEALRNHPLAFRATHAHEAAQSDDYFRQRLSNGAVFGAFVDGALVATAGLAPDPDLPSRGVVWGVYVRDDRRGGGLAQAVIEALLAASRARHHEFRLRVIATNGPARAVYERLGFRKTSVERSLAADGATYEYEWWLLQADGR